MKFTIKSRKLNSEIAFFRPGRRYVFAILNGQLGTLGIQICDGGHTSGNPISYVGDDQEQFKKICRHWYRAFIRNNAWDLDTQNY